MTQVVAALIFERDKFLICQRPQHKARGLLWEFVGGKVEDGETKQQALKRECFEELAVEINVFEEFMTVLHEYPDITIELTIFYAEISKGTPKMLEHNDIKWIRKDEIENFDFCPADTQILEKIKNTPVTRTRLEINSFES
ncbi:MAG: (deoxy)nucleoside triphosphate pyrophosphohydrolase [Acutalibacteraceae bacterium]